MKRGIHRRQALKQLGGVVSGGLLGRELSPAGCGEEEKKAIIVRENARPGTRDWMLERTRVDPQSKYRCPWIEGYVSKASVRVGETLTFHVSTAPASAFTIDLYRLGYYGGDGGRWVQRLGPFEGRVQPDPEVGPKRLRVCAWEACAELEIPRDWVSGVYVGKLTAERDGTQSYVIFIVRDDRNADFLFQCSDNTWQAYNRWPSQYSLYDNGETPWYWGGGVEVSYRRPYGKYCQILDAPLSTGSGEFFLWEFPFAYWMESLGYEVSYISNLDTHRDGEGLLRAKGLLSVGHDEYWTAEMYENVSRAIGAGVSVGFFSGNAVCGRVKLGSEGDSFERVGVFGPPGGTREFESMRSLEHERPYANELMGAHSTGPVTGGADWVCTLPEHWIYEGTGMKLGERIPGVIGWEYHGDPAPMPGLEVVAKGLTQSAPGAPNGGLYTGTVYSGPKGNVVFNAATCWWADGLSEPPGYVRPKVYTEPKGPDARLQRITRNVLERMKQGAAPSSEGTRSRVLSVQGCGRATGYAEANKIVSREGRTHVAWLDSPSEGFRVRVRTYDRGKGHWSPIHDVGEAFDNHGGPALTMDAEGYLHMVYYPHHHAMRYRRSTRPNDASAWEKEVSFGERLTYPTLVCAKDGTLIMTARRSHDDQPWEVELWRKAPGEKWERQGGLLRAQHRGYAHFQESLAWGPDHRTLHLCGRFHEKSDGGAYGRLQAVAYLVSPDAGKTWRRADGTEVALPATMDTVEVLAHGGVDAGRVLRAGGMAVDGAGRPLVTYSEREEGRDRLFLLRREATGEWRRRDVVSILPPDWERRQLTAPAGVTVTASGDLVIAAQGYAGVLEESTWGHPQMEVIRLISRDAGETFDADQISAGYRQRAHWLPNLERPTGHHTIPEIPALLYTAGGPGEGNRDLLANDVLVDLE